MPAVPISDLPAGVVLGHVQNSDESWPARRTARTDLYGAWLRTVGGSADPPAATTPGTTTDGAYPNDFTFGVT